MSIKNPTMRLTTDLTSYVSGLVEGTEGIIRSFTGSNDCFARVDFPSLGINWMDILWKSIEITDEEHLAHVAEAEQNFEKALKTAREVVLRVGPKGGFKILSYTYTELNGTVCHCSTGFKEDGNKLISIFEKYAIPVKKTLYVA